jgi:hypothetical protein
MQASKYAVCYQIILSCGIPKVEVFYQSMTVLSVIITTYHTFLLGKTSWIASIPGKIRAESDDGGYCKTGTMCLPIWQAATIVLPTVFQGADERFPWLKPKDGLCLGKAWKPLICSLKDHRKTPSQESRAVISIGPHISIHTALIRTLTLPSQGTHQP